MKLRKLIGGLGSIALALGLVATAQPAMADQVSNGETSNATVTRAVQDYRGYALKNTQGLETHNAERGTTVALNHITPTLFNVNVDGQTVQAYCIEVKVHALFPATGKVADWDAYQGDNSAKENQTKINWVVANSFPVLKTEDVAKKAGIDGLTQREAITATQAAIWHYADQFNYDGLATSDQATSSRVEKLYNYLTGEANTGLDVTPGGSKVELSFESTGESEVEAGSADYELGTLTADIVGADSAEVLASSDNLAVFQLEDQAGVNKLDGSQTFSIATGEKLTLKADASNMQEGDSAEISFTSQQLTDAGFTAKIIQPTKGDKKSQSIVLVEKDAPQGSTTNASFQVKGLTETVSGSVSVGDYVWHDVNRDGVQDEDESGIEGVTLTLVGPDGESVTDVDGQEVAPTQTDADGLYSFDNLPVLEEGQSYTVKVTNPEGYVQTVPNATTRDKDSDDDEASSQGLTEDGQRDDTLDFGFYKDEDEEESPTPTPTPEPTPTPTPTPEPGDDDSEQPVQPGDEQPQDKKPVEPAADQPKQDDSGLAKTGATTAGLLAVALAMAGAGVALLLARRNKA